MMIADKAIGRSSIDQAATLAFLSDPSSYPDHPSRLEAIETHMSRVFIVGDEVYKMKKAIRLDFVDFSSLDGRRANCERELALNQRLAPGVYKRLVPVVRAKDGRLQLGGAGEPVEWLVVMQKLDRERLLDSAIRAEAVLPVDIEQLCKVLGEFYRETPGVAVTPGEWLRSWHDAVALNVRTLTDRIFALPEQLVAAVVAAERSFIADHADLLAARAGQGRIIDCHGDLRPEHVHLGPPIRLVDRLEFNERLRWLDPFDEAMLLAMECERLGAIWIRQKLVDGLAKQLDDRPPDLLLSFYAGHRAAMRARLSIEHMRDPDPRTPERWPKQTCEYLELALRCSDRVQS